YNNNLYFQWGINSLVHNKTYMNNGLTSSGGTYCDYFTFDAIGGRSNNTVLNFHGYIGDILIYNEILSDSSRLLVENYLRTKYTPYPDLGKDTIVCNNEYRLGFRTDHGYSSITWSNGQTNVDSITATISGTYWVTVKSFGLTLTDTIEVEVRDRPQLSFQTDTISCLENDLFLSYTNLGAFEYTWSNGSAADTLFNLSSGNYFISQNDTASGCIINSEPVNVRIDSFSIQSTLGADRDFCLGSNLELQTTTTNNEPYIYNWSTFDTNYFIELNTVADTLINVEVTDAYGCVVKDTILASVINLASPSIDFIADTVCFGNPSHFTSVSSAAGLDNINNYVWSFPNNTSVSGSSSSQYTHSNNLTYNVNLTIYTDSNCENRITKPVYIYRLPVVNFNKEIICAKNSVNFNDNSYTFFPDNINNYSWYINNTLESNQEDPNLIFASEGNSELKLIVESDFGCVNEYTDSLEVFPELSADFSFTNSCIGDSVLFIDETSSFSVVDWNWSFGNIATSNLESPKMVFDNVGSLLVNLEVENAIGCKNSVAKNVFISPQPKASFNYDKACENDESLFYDNSLVLNDSIITYHWQIDTFAYSGDSIKHVFAEQSIYVASLNIETENGCADDTTIFVTVHEKPSADFEFSPNYGTAPLEVEFNNLTTGVNAYDWNFGDGTGFSNEENPSYTFNENGIFNISLTATNSNNCADKIEKEIAIIPSDLDIELSNLEFEIQENVNGSFSIKPKLQIKNVGTRLITNADLLLNLDQDNKIAQQWQQDIAIGSATNYTFDAYYLINDIKNTKYVCVEAINVNDNTEVNFNNNKTCKLLDGIVQFSNPYPNPAENKVQLDIITEDEGLCSMQVFSIYGKSMTEKQSIQLKKGYNNIQLNTSVYLSGKYIIMMEYLEENYTKSFVIK
ncbi:MAG: PKD domain-containing protein, partial [Chitinophagales bacterium]